MLGSKCRVSSLTGITQAQQACMNIYQDPCRLKESGHDVRQAGLRNAKQGEYIA